MKFSFHRFSALLISLALVTLVGCSSGDAIKRDQQRINFVQNDRLSTQEFVMDLLKYASGANELVSIQAHEGRPITIDAKSFTVKAPIDLEAIFNSAAFQRDYGDLFPPTTNGFDAFIAFLSTVEKIAGNPVPWLASALKTQSRQGGVKFEGNNNSVATRESSIDNSDNSDRSDRSDRSDNSDNSDNRITNPEPTEPAVEGEGG